MSKQVNVELGQGDSHKLHLLTLMQTGIAETTKKSSPFEKAKAFNYVADLLIMSEIFPKAISMAEISLGMVDQIQDIEKQNEIKLFSLVLIIEASYKTDNKDKLHNALKQAKNLIKDHKLKDENVLLGALFRLSITEHKLKNNDQAREHFTSFFDLWCKNYGDKFLVEIKQVVDIQALVRGDEKPKTLLGAYMSLLGTYSSYAKEQYKAMLQLHEDIIKAAELKIVLETKPHSFVAELEDKRKQRWLPKGV